MHQILAFSKKSQAINAKNKQIQCIKNSHKFIKTPNILPNGIKKHSSNPSNDILGISFALHKMNKSSWSVL